MNNVIEVLFDRNKNNPNKIALRDEQSSITYHDLEQRSRKVATFLLNKGIKSGDRINVVLYDRIDTVVAMCAIVLIGAVACMVNPRKRKENQLYEINHVDPALTIVEANLDIPNAVSINDIIDASENLQEWLGPCTTVVDDMAFMLWTSGTTGHGKAVMQNHRNFLETSQLIAVETIGITSTDKIYTTAKLFFSIGILASLFWPLYTGAEAYLDSGLSVPARVRKNITEYQPTLFWSVPVIYSQISEQPLQCQAKCLCGGDLLPQRVIDRWRESTGLKLHNTSGTTEATCCITYNLEGTTGAGTKTKCYDIRVVDDQNNILPAGQVGKLQVQTKYQALGYYNDPKWTSEVFGREWMPTGDYAYISEDGQLNYMGRINDAIKVNGQFINPSEIEDSLQNYPGVEQAAVISRPGPDELERIEAYVVPAKNVELNPQEIRRWMLSHHEKYACPRIINIVEKLPRTDTGKVQRFVLKQQTA